MKLRIQPLIFLSLLAFQPTVQAACSFENVWNIGKKALCWAARQAFIEKPLLSISIILEGKMLWNTINHKLKHTSKQDKEALLKKKDNEFIRDNQEFLRDNYITDEEAQPIIESKLSEIGINKTIRSAIKEKTYTFFSDNPFQTGAASSNSIHMPMFRFTSRQFSLPFELLHEYGHIIHKHTHKKMLVQASLLLAASYLTSPFTKSVPKIIFSNITAWIIVNILNNAFSRICEKQADAYAFQHLQGKAAEHFNAFNNMEADLFAVKFTDKKISKNSSLKESLYKNTTEKPSMEDRIYQWLYFDHLSPYDRYRHACAVDQKFFEQKQLKTML